jgi:hypothetical protein
VKDLQQLPDRGCGPNDESELQQVMIAVFEMASLPFIRPERPEKWMIVNHFEFLWNVIEKSVHFFA